MIQYLRHNDILTLDDLHLPSYRTALTPQEMSHINDVRILEVREHAHFQRDIPSILRSFLDMAADTHHIHLVFLEPYPQPTSYIRSKKGLFGPHRNRIAQHARFELEVAVSSEETLWGGIIRLTAKNAGEVLSMLDELPFAFGLLTSRDKRSFTSSRADFLHTIITQILQPGAIYRPNPLKLAAFLTRPKRAWFTLRDLNDTEYFRIFFHHTDQTWAEIAEQEVRGAPVVGFS